MRSVYWDYQTRKQVLENAIGQMSNHPKEVVKATSKGKFTNTTVVNHVFNVAQEELAIPQEQRRGKMSPTDVYLFNQIWNKV